MLVILLKSSKITDNLLFWVKLPVYGHFAVGHLAVGHFAVGYFAVGTLRRTYALGHFAVVFLDIFDILTDNFSIQITCDRNILRPHFSKQKYAPKFLSSAGKHV